MTRYNIMQKSNTRSGEGTFYPDPLTLPLDKFRVTKPPLEYEMRQLDPLRPDILFYKAYRTSDFYDVVFLLNNYGYIDDIEIGSPLLLPDKNDLQDFFLSNRI